MKPGTLDNAPSPAPADWLGRAQAALAGLTGWQRALLLLLPGVFLIAGVSVMVAGRFDGLYGQDPYAYYDYATGPLREAVRQLAAPPPFFWPPGYPLLVLAATTVAGITPLAGQVVSLLMGGLAAVAAGLYARELWRAWGEGDAAWPPLAVAVLVACHGQLWQSSAVVMSDTSGLAFATLGAWLLLRYGRLRQARWLALAAAALAAALITRWIYGLVAVPLAVYALAALRSAGRRSWLHAVLAALPAALILSPVFVPALAGLLDPSQASAPFAGDFMVVDTWSPLNALRRSFITLDGTLSYRLPNGVYYAAAPAHAFYFTPLLAVLLLPGLYAAWQRRRSLALVFVVAGWAAIVYAFLAGAQWQNLRFTLAYLPPLAVLVVLGLQAVFERARGWLRPAVAGVFALGLAWMLAGAVTLTERFIDRKAHELDMVARVEAQLPEGARLLAFGPTLTLQHYGAVETLELFTLTPAELSVLLDQGRPLYVLVDVHGLETQWHAHTVAAHYRRLRDEAGLETLEQFEVFTLFRVRVP